MGGRGEKLTLERVNGQFYITLSAPGIPDILLQIKPKAKAEAIEGARKLAARIHHLLLYAAADAAAGGSFSQAKAENLINHFLPEESRAKHTRTWMQKYAPGIYAAYFEHLSDEELIRSVIQQKEALLSGGTLRFMSPDGSYRDVQMPNSKLN